VTSELCAFKSVQVLKRHDLGSQFLKHQAGTMPQEQTIKPTGSTARGQLCDHLIALAEAIARLHLERSGSRENSGVRIEPQRNYNVSG
jgi:hypothetical protein